MKLLYLSTPSFADCDFPLIKAFQEKGIDVTYLILLPPYSLKSTLFNIKKQIPKTGIFPATEYDDFKVYEKYMDMSKVFIANRTGQKSYSPSYIKHLFDLYNFIKKGKFDIIHADVMMSGNMKFLFKLVPHWVQTIHDPFPHSGEADSRKQQRYNVTISNTDKLVILNHKQKEEFCSFYNLNPDKVLVNRLGVYDNIKTFVKSEWKERPNNVLFFGRISQYKGIEYLCEAMVKVRKVIPDATLTIAGGGKMYFDISKYEKLPYIEVRNHYIEMEELAEVLAQCSISVCPYTDATQSGVIMTSYSLGKPVIATNVGGLGEMIEDGKSGVLVPAKDSDALANAIIDLLKDTSKLQSMSDYILYEYNTGEKSWNSIADKYIDYYRQVNEN